MSVRCQRVEQVLETETTVLQGWMDVLANMERHADGFQV